MTAVRAPRRRASSDVQGGFDFSRPDEIVCSVDKRAGASRPVVAAAVILDPAQPIDGLDDSKALSARRAVRADRRALAVVLRRVGKCRRDRHAEHPARDDARDEAGGRRLSVLPTLAQIDGNRCPTLTVRAEAIVSGALVPSISAASILAKVTRDRMLVDLHERFPVYGFNACGLRHRETPCRAARAKPIGARSRSVRHST